MKIVFISRYQGKVQRGVENYVSALSSRLAKRHQVEVLTSTFRLIGKKPEIIYPLNGGLQALFCRLYSWLIGAKLVLGGHAGIGRDDRWNLYLFPDLFIAFSRKGYQWAGKVNPWIKMVRIPHGVDLTKFNPRVKPKRLGLKRPIFITVSHLVPYKRVEETVRAMAKLKLGSLLVLGKGPEENKIDRLGKSLLGPKRYRRLKTSHNVVPSYLAAADVFTLVSGSQEAFGLAYLEALASNLPVVATDDSLRRELINDAGLFVKNPEDVGEYSKRLQAASKRSWEDKPRKQAEGYGWKKIIGKYETTLNRLAILKR